MTIKIEYSEIFEEVRHRLGYISGKRSETAEEFHRVAACEADEKMLRQLASETCLMLYLGAGRFLKGFSFSADSMELLMSVPAKPSPETEREVSLLIRDFIVKGVIWRWLRLVGAPCHELFAQDSGDGIAGLSERLNTIFQRPDSLKPRPFGFF